MVLLLAFEVVGCGNEDGGGGGPSPVPVRLAFTATPSDAEVSVPLTPAVEVAVEDAAGNPVTTASDVVTVAIQTNPGGATLSGTTSVSAVNGIATFADLTISKAGSGYTLVATAGSLTSATSDPIDIAFALTTLGVGQDGRHTCGLTPSGVAYCWGRNNAGQLGDGNAGTDSDIPVAVAGGHNFSAIGGGGLNSCGLTPSGTAFCWGGNNVGQLGDGNGGTDSDIPVAVTGGLTFTALSPGAPHTCGLASSGVAFCWGGNALGQLGDGNAGTDSDIPVAVAGGHSFTAITAGSSYTCGLTSGGAALCWGGNSQGQLGDGNAGTDSDTPVAVLGGLTFTALSAGGHTCGLAPGGAAFCWGFNGFGQLGDGNGGTSSDTPVAVAGGLSFSTLSAGSSNTCGVVPGGAAFCWGFNGSGQLGDGNPGTNSDTPVAVYAGLSFTIVSVGSDHTCGLTPGGSAYCWGENDVGQLGDGNGPIGSSTPVQVSGP